MMSPSVALTDRQYRHCTNAQDSNAQRQESTSTITSNIQDDTIRRLTIASILCTIFIIVEIIGGTLSSSLAVLSDAAHLFADLASFVVAIIAAKLAMMPPNRNNTFGYHRAEALAALYSMSCLWIVSAFLGVEALHRGYDFVFGSGHKVEEVDGKIMSITAAIGVVVNISLAFVLGHNHHHGHGHGHGHGHSHGHNHNSHNHSHDHSHSHADDHDHEGTHLLHDEEHQYPPAAAANGSTSHPHSHSTSPTTTLDENLNLKAAYLHVLADLLQSLSVFFSGLIIWYNPHWKIIDPCITILFCIFVMKTTISVITPSISILMNDVPPNIDWEEVYNAISVIEGVYDVHDLHIWAIGSSTAVSNSSNGSSISLSVHATADDVDKALEEIQDVCVRRFGIRHTTIQLKSAKKKSTDDDTGANTESNTTQSTSTSKMRIGRKGR